MVISPRSGGGNGYFWVFLENRVCAKGYGLYAKKKKPTDRRHRHLTFYRSEFFKMPLFLSYNSSKDLVPNQGSVEILDPNRSHIMLSFPISSY